MSFNSILEIQSMTFRKYFKIEIVIINSKFMASFFKNERLAKNDEAFVLCLYLYVKKCEKTYLLLVSNYQTGWPKK
jgi:hypothetical protein